MTTVNPTIEGCGVILDLLKKRSDEEVQGFQNVGPVCTPLVHLLLGRPVWMRTLTEGLGTFTGLADGG